MFNFYDVTREGPGVSKNEPKKRTLVVFFEVYARKFWNLMVAGLLWLVVSLPLVTRGWADAGLTFITRNFSRQKHAFVKDDFFETIKKNRKQAFVCGLINLLITGVIFFNFLFYALALYPGLYALFGVDISGQQLQALQPDLMHLLSIGCTLLGHTLFTWMKYYMPFLVVTFKLRTSQVYKNAFLFAVVGLKENLLISVVLLLVYGFMLGIFLLIPTPLTIVLLVFLWILLVPAFRSYLIQFTIFPLVKKLMIDPYYAQNPDADKQARLDLNLEVEEKAPASAEEPEAAEPVFSDEQRIPEPTHIPKQYSEKEMRRFNKRIHGVQDDDETI